MLNLSGIHSPGDAIFGVMMLVACLVFGAFPVLKMINWWMEGGVEPIVAMVSLFLYLVLLFSVTMLPPPLAIFIVLMMLAAAVLMPYFGQISEDVQNRRIGDEQMESYARALEENPTNHAARMGLAEALHKRGEIDQAIEHMSWVLQQSPGLSFRIRPQLEGWKREKERQGVPQPIFCHECRGENHPQATHCVECGAAFGVGAGMQQRMWREGGPRMVLRAWIVTASTVILACFLFLELPAIIAGPIILATVIVAAWLFLRWVGGDMGTVGD